MYIMFIHLYIIYSTILIIVQCKCMVDALFLIIRHLTALLSGQLEAKPILTKTTRANLKTIRTPFIESSD